MTEDTSREHQIQKLDDLKKARIVSLGVSKVPGESTLILFNEQTGEEVRRYKIEGSNTSNPTFPMIPDNPKKYSKQTERGE